jgi:hypothetical protein
VAAGVISHRRSYIFWDLIQVGEKFFEGTRVSLRMLLQSGIEIGHIGVVVFFVVEVHGLFVYSGL